MILDGWAVKELYSDSDDPLYYSGNGTGGSPIFSSMSAKTRIYRSERAARAAVNLIRCSGYEGAPEICRIREDVPDIQPQISMNINLPAPPDGWKVLDFFGAALLLLHDGKRFAICCHGQMGSPIDNAILAADEWCELRGRIVRERLSRLCGGN